MDEAEWALTDPACLWGTDAARRVLRAPAPACGAALVPAMLHGSCEGQGRAVADACGLTGRGHWLLPSSQTKKQQPEIASSFSQETAPKGEKTFGADVSVQAQEFRLQPGGCGRASSPPLPTRPGGFLLVFGGQQPALGLRLPPPPWAV